MKAQGELSKASKQAKLAKQCKAPAKVGLETISLDEEEQEALASKITAKPEGASSTDAAESIKESLDKIKVEGLCTEESYKYLETLIEAARYVPKNYDDYCEIITTREAFRRFIQEAIMRCADAQVGDEEQGNDKNQDQDDRKRKKEVVKKSLEGLHILVCASIDQSRLVFIQNVLACPGETKHILFTNILPTEENIHKRYRELARQFHPDKAKQFSEEHRSATHDLMTRINHCKDELLQNLARASAARSKLAFYQEQGDNFWARYMDYKHASKGEWNELKIFRQADLTHLSKDALNKSSLEHVTRAYEAYRACCRVADKDQYLRSQIQLRGSIALCLYASGSYLDAQLYALGAMKLIFDKSQHVTQEDLSRAKAILSKVQGRTSERGEAPTTTSGSTSTSRALVGVEKDSSALATVQKKHSFTEKNKIKSAIDQDLAAISKQLILSSNRNLVKYQAPQEEILRAKTEALSRQIIGHASRVSGLTVGAMFCGTGIIGAIETIEVVAVATTAAAISVPAVATLMCFAGSVALFRWGFESGSYFLRKGQDALQEPKTREELNAIIRKALANYDQGKPQEFFEALATKYDTDKQLLPSLKDLRRHMPAATHIIETLTKHGFRPDGIAYLFNLMGEALSSGKVSIPDCDLQDLTNLAKSRFEDALDEKLVQLTQSLDTRISEMRKKSLGGIAASTVSKLTDFLLLRDEGYLAREHVEDAQEMPFRARLEEMCNGAKVNIAIIRIVRGDEKAIDEAKKLIKEVRNSIDRYGQFHAKPAMRLEAIEDFLWIVSGQTADIETLALPEAADQPSAEEDIYLAFLDDQLAKTSSGQERASIYNRRAAHHAKRAQEAAKVARLGSLQYWQKALKDYTSALSLINNHEKSGLGYMQCLFELSKYDEAFRYFQPHPSLSNNPDAWIIASMAHRKQFCYPKAKECIWEALQQDPKSQEAARQKTLLERLQASAIEERLNGYRSAQIRYEEPYFDARRKRENEKEYYTILSLDGGGVRGVLSALWLSEIESRTKRPIAHLFNMLAGTSTGAIIAAGLSVPQIDVHEVRGEVEQEEVLSPYRPRYSASDMVELYRQKSPEIFTKSSRWTIPGSPLVVSKYTAVGRSSIFEKYFGQARLNQALTELVIPAVSEANFTSSYLFSRSTDVKLHDVLMATTAAPTFFPPYEIPEVGVFVDGAIQANNPAMNAHSEALRYGIPPQRIFMLSLGAGTCIPNPLAPDLHRGQLFWAGNFPHVSLALQEGESDRHMRSILGNCYQRWQVWLERPIGIDAYQKMDTLLELGQQHLEELYASDENTMNKLLEFLEENPAPQG
ncbi:MAG: patatin-like phospholipase family protein [Bacteroidota bacterium]